MFPMRACVCVCVFARSMFTHSATHVCRHSIAAVRRSACLELEGKLQRLEFHIKKSKSVAGRPLDEDLAVTMLLERCVKSSQK